LLKSLATLHHKISQ